MLIWLTRQQFSYTCCSLPVYFLWWGIHCRFGCVDFLVRIDGLELSWGSSIPTSYHIQTVCYAKCSGKTPYNSNNAICYSWSVNYTVIHSGKCQLTVKTATQRKRRGSPIFIWLLQLFLGFESCDVRELICIQVRGEGFSNGKAMIKYINAGSVYNGFY